VEIFEAIILSVLAASTPLLIAATGELVTERSGVLNLGVEGMMIVGAACGFGGAWLTGSIIVGAICGIVAGTLLFKLLAPKGSLWIGNGIQNLAAGIVLTPIALAFADIHDIVPSEKLLGAFLFLVLGGSILAFVLWFHLLKVCGAVAASAYHFMMPPLGMLFAWMVLGEHMALLDLLGIVPVALGIYLVTRPSASTNRSRA